MRKTTYRVFNKKTGHFETECYIECITGRVTTNKDIAKGFPPPNQDDYIIQQWTGFFDKNNVPIFEGDMLDCYGNFVMFQNGCYCVAGDRRLSDYINKNTEIIGNNTGKPYKQIECINKNLKCIAITNGEYNRVGDVVVIKGDEVRIELL